MDNLLREGEDFLNNQGGNQNNFQDNQQGQQGQQDQQGQQGQRDQQDQRDQQSQQGQQNQQGQQGQQGGGFMKSFEQNAGDSYINQEANQFMSREGVPTAMDGAIDGALDTEVNNLEKRF